MLGGRVQIERDRRLGGMVVPGTGRCRIAGVHVLLHQIGEVLLACQTREVRVGKGAALLLHFLVLLRCVLEEAENAPLAKDEQIVVVVAVAGSVVAVVVGDAVVRCRSDAAAAAGCRIVMVAEQFVDVRIAAVAVIRGRARCRFFGAAGGAATAATEAIRLAERRRVQHFLAGHWTSSGRCRRGRCWWFPVTDTSRWQTDAVGLESGLWRCSSGRIVAARVEQRQIGVHFVADVVSGGCSSGSDRAIVVFRLMRRSGHSQLASADATKALRLLIVPHSNDWHFV